MTTKDKIFATLFSLLLLTALVLYFFPQKQDLAPAPQPIVKPGATPPPPTGGGQQFADEIEISLPETGGVVSSPIAVAGRALGSWFFEANMPVTLLDANQKVLARAPLHADSEWMTPDFVPFSGSIVFDKPETETGFLVFENDNPSGLPENAKSFTISVRFK